MALYSTYLEDDDWKQIVFVDMKFRVLQVFASLDMGGAECRMMDVYRMIDRNEFDFDFVTLQSGEQYFEKEIKSLGGNIFKLPSPREVGIFKHIHDLRKLMREGNYDAVHAHTSYHCGIVMYAAKKEGIPVRISHARTNGTIQNSIKTELFIGFGRILVNYFSTQKLAISDLCGDFLFGNSSYTVIPNSIDLSIYPNISNEHINSLMNELGICENDLVIGHVGRFDRFKNQRFVIDVFYELQKLVPASKLVLVGDGELRSEIQQYVIDLKLEESVIFTGVRNDVPLMMSLFNLLIFPSIVEGLGGVVLEAQAAGTPAVISNNVPTSVDVGLGLIKRCSLESPKSEWIRMIYDCLQVDKPSFESIQNQFNQSGYSLASSIKKYSDIYKGIITDD